MISFCIITDGKEMKKLGAQFDSVAALGIRDYEIVVSGNLKQSDLEMYAGITVVPIPTLATQGRLGALRNAACAMTRGDILVVTDDDMRFEPGWYEGLQHMGDDWDVLSCVIHNPDGTRYWDWKAHLNGKNWLLDYNETSPHQSLTGGMTIMRAWVWEKVQWDNERGFNQMEDVDFTQRLKAAGVRIAFNPHSAVTHDAPYTQQGAGVFKYAI